MAFVSKGMHNNPFLCDAVSRVLYDGLRSLGRRSVSACTGRRILMSEDDG
jgi:hypothetical protein